MATAAPQRMTLAEFLSWDDGTDTHDELVLGCIGAPSLMHRRDGSPAERRGTIVSNLGRHLGNRLTPPCRVVSQAGNVLPERDDTCSEADLAVPCAPPDPNRHHVAEPVLSVEILSPSTAQHGRGTKLPDYCELPSVREILLASSQERRVQRWRRSGDEWTVRDLIGEAELPLDVIDAAIPLTAVYEGTAM